MAKIFSCTVKKGFKKKSTIGRTLLHENTVAGQLSLIKKITFEIQPIFQLLMQLINCASCTDSEERDLAETFTKSQGVSRKMSKITLL